MLMDMHLSSPVAAEPFAMPTVAPSLVVLTSVDGVLQDGIDGSCELVQGAMDILAARDIPVVLSSHHCADDLISLQCRLRLQHPFICDSGTSLYLPKGYFGDLPGFGRHESGWEVIGCAPARRAGLGEIEESGQAVRLLVSLYRVCREDALIIGIASSWRDRVLLREVDVPIVVRRDDPDQARLVRKFPTAYVTEGCGPVGWREAILGSYEA
jgi:predicted mannosyl-3-phosphoglycerate phosphatase (HAD superfamily)